MIDGGVFLGRNLSTGQEFSSPETLIRFLDEHEISRAIVSSYKSLYFDFKIGNSEILDLAKQFPNRIIPAISIVPEGFDRIADSNYLSESYQRGARVLSFFTHPEYYELDLESIVVKHLVREASRLGFVIQWGIRSSDELSKILLHYHEIKTPQLIRFMTGRVYESLSTVLLAIKECPQFYFDIGSLTPSGTIKHLVNSGGLNRLYVASNSPDGFFLSSAFLADRAGLSKEERARLLSGNLEEVFNLASDAKDLSPNSFVEKKWARLKAFPKIDTHFHIDGWNLIEPEKDPRFFQIYFEKMNYRALIISSIEALNYDIRAGNSRARQIVESHPGIFASIVIDPLQLEVSLEEIRKYSQHPKFVGLKTIQDRFNLSLDDPRYLKLFEAGERAGLSVMAHIPGLHSAAKKFPKVHFICAHSTWDRVGEKVFDANVFYDIATSHADRGETQLKRLAEKTGVSKILYSSDAPLMDPVWTLGKIATESWTDEELNQIFARNALEAFPKLKKANIL